MPRPASTMLLALVVLLSRCALAAAADEREAFFEVKIRPLLVTHCVKCHGADKQSGGLRVDSRAALVAGGDSGAAIVPSDPAGSLLVKAIRREGYTQMPPDETLSAEQVADFTAWIRAGAVWPASVTTDAFAAGRHWAFQQRSKVEPPAASSNDALAASTNEIDRFIAARRAQHGLKVTAPSDRRALLRRAYFDLVGLPPSPDELNAFAADDTPDAFARVVDRLLASPRYGERWGRHWMDVVRYSDTAGDNADYPVPELRLYRDYIIRSFNDDKPFDQFIREQVAGDLLAAAGPRERFAEQTIATGFVAISRRYATMPEELWHLTLEDTIDVFGQAFLGLSLRCARCHDHKFDPVTTADYYALYGIFASTKYPYPGSEEYQSKNLNRAGFPPLLPPDEVAPRAAAHAANVERLRAAFEAAEKNDPFAARIAELQAHIDALRSATGAETIDESADAEGRRLQEEATRLAGEQKKLRKQQDDHLSAARSALRDAQRSGLPPDVPGAYAVADGKPHDAAIHLRGEPTTPGAVVPRAAPRFLPNAELKIPAGASGRLQVAEWLTSAENPLTARVIVNRVWQHHFGRGIVATPSDFGLRGERPTHPELLDWLTEQFVAEGWSVKKLHRRIMLSATYQLSSAAAGDEFARSRAADPDNRFLWRGDRRRLDAEAIRDALLAVSGQLDLEPAEAHPFPPLNQWHWTQHDAFKQVYPSKHRSVYLMTQRLQRHPFLALFDGSDTNYSTAVRTEATAPQQALFFMNNTFAAEQARDFAGRLISAESDPAARIALAAQLAWGRAPREDEQKRFVEYVAQFREALTASGCAPDRLEQDAWTSFARVLLSANEFLYVD